MREDAARVAASEAADAIKEAQVRGMRLTCLLLGVCEKMVLSNVPALGAACIYSACCSVVFHAT